MLECNVGSVPTYSRYNANSIVDVTFSRIRMNGTVSGWVVRPDINSESDHRYVTFEVVEEVGNTSNTRHKLRGWARRQFNAGSLMAQSSPFRHYSFPTACLDPNGMAEEVSGVLAKMCDASMPRRLPFRGRRPVHWWSSEIAELRKASGAARRRYQRCGRRANMESRDQERASYVAARHQLRSAIRKAQEEAWGRLCMAVDNDPWGLPYRVVTKNIGGRTPLPPDLEVEIASALFPQLPELA